MDDDFSDDGVVLGEYADAEGGVAFLSDEDRRRSLYILGRSGTGKTTLIETMVQSDTRRGLGYALLDPHGDLAERVADTIPIKRENHVIYVDPAEADLFEVLSAVTITGPDAQNLLWISFHTDDPLGMVSVRADVIAGQAVARWRDMQSAALAKALLARASHSEK
jgi:hypothetical protein